MPPTLQGAFLRASLERRFEGRSVLDVCLQRAGSTYSASEAEDELRAAAAAGATPDEVFPALFHDDVPTVADSEQNRRLYSNLFGLWDSVSGMALPVPDDELPEPGRPLPAAFVEACWKEADLLSHRELSAQWDRFANTQSDLLTWLGSRGLPDGAFDTAATVAFETWRAYRRAFGDAVRPLPIEAFEAGGGPEREPALADFAAEAVEIAEGEGLDAAGAAEPLSVLRTAMHEAWSRPG